MRQFGSNFLLRLLRDRTANVLALSGAAIIPLLLIVGSTVDISRFYMATSRLQNACDSGALAARKAMLDNDFSSEERAQGLSFFDHNYPTGTFGLEELTRDYTADDEGIVTGTASGRMPTTIMNFFGHGEFQLAVTCQAEVNISNTDIMFVLDVTGSMNCPDNDPSCWGRDTEAPNSRIQGLREAVVAFYDVVDDATSPSAQVRYGFVPYSNNVNVGRSIPTQFMATQGAYQTRVPQWDNTSSDWEELSFTIDSIYNQGSVNEWYWYNPNGHNVASESACISLAQNSNLAFEDTYVDGTMQDHTINVVSETVDGNIRTTVLTARGQFQRADAVHWWGWYYGSNCFVDLEYDEYWADFQATIVEEIDQTQEFDEWLYTFNDGSDPDAPMWDVSGMYTDGFITLPTGNNGSDQVHTWDGCIEEAATVDTATFDPLPANAHDLNINLLPANDDQRWKPSLPNAVYGRSWGGWTTNDVRTSSNTNNRVRVDDDYVCPSAATRLAEMDRQDVVDYLNAGNGFTARGNTYHDLGMIWGARFITPNGLFAADNAIAPNGDAIGRHIVFMTDGVLSINNEIYTPYGVHWWDRRVSSSTNSNTVASRHAARFQAVCRQARAENISVWVVAFGTSLSQNLIDCSTPGRAFEASDSDDLADAFEEIAQKIASLRLTG